MERKANSGIFYRRGDTEEYYVLSGFNIGGKSYAVLIDIEDGNRWTEPKEVGKLMKIKEDEWNKIAWKGNFELVGGLPKHVLRGFLDKPESQIEEKEEPELPEDDDENEEGIMQLAELFEEEEK